MLRPRRALAALPLALAALFAGCANNLSGTGLPTTSASASLPPVQADPALFAKLPAEVQASKTIVVGNSPTYPPVEFLQGGQVVGLDRDLFDAAAARLGVRNEWRQSEFDQILIGLQAKKYDVGVSAFTVTPEREKTVNMVSYLSAGSLWVVQQGNPAKVVQGKPCGLTVAVQTGVVQEMEMKNAQATCGANPIKLLSFTDQGEATNALLEGRAQVMAADSPVAAYAVKMSGGKAEALDEPYDAAPYGLVVRKDQAQFAEAIAQAFRDLEASGHYQQILATWGQTDGAVKKFEVNP